MPLEWPQKIFVTGTDTNVGKTLVCALLVAGLGAEYWKPIQSGLAEKTDTQWIKEKTGLPQDYFHPETYRLSRPLSPHAAAAHDGVHIHLERFRVPAPATGRNLIVEGAGGIMVPLNEKHFMRDLMQSAGLPVLLVARSTLGTINHTLLSLEQLRRDQIPILGVVLNGPKNAINKQAIASYGQTNILAEIEPLPRINAQSLAAEFKAAFTVQGFF